jgi:hypothetical protein
LPEPEGPERDGLKREDDQPSHGATTTVSFPLLMAFDRAGVADRESGASAEPIPVEPSIGFAVLALEADAGDPPP